MFSDKEKESIEIALNQSRLLAEKLGYKRDVKYYIKLIEKVKKDINSRRAV